MGDCDEVVAAVHLLLKKLNADPELESSRILRILHKLDRLPITVQVLQETGVGKAVNRLRKRGGEITEAVKRLVQSWKELVREAMEAEERSRASPEQYSSPSPQSQTSDDEEDEEESDEDEDSDSESSSESEDERSSTNHSPEPSPPYNSPPASPAVDYKRRQSSSSPLTKERNYQVCVSEKQLVSPKRHREPSPTQVQNSPKTHSSNSASSPVKKRRIDQGSSLNSKESSKVVRKKLPEDDNFSQALFPSPKKVGSSLSSSVTKSPVQTQKDIGGDRNGSAMKQSKSGFSPLKLSSSSGDKGSVKSLASSPPKKIDPKNDKERVKSKKTLNGSVREPETSFLDMVDDVDVTKLKAPSVKTSKMPSKLSSKSSSKLSSSASSPSKSSSQKKPGSASLALQSERHESQPSRTVEKPMKGEPNKSSSKSSKESKPSLSLKKLSSKSDTDFTSIKTKKDPEAKSTHKQEAPAAKVKRKHSSGERRMSEEGTQSFGNTGMSFGDVLMGPVPSKVKKPVKRLNPSATDTAKKSSSSITNKESSKSSKSSSSSSSSKKSSPSSQTRDSSLKHATHKTSESKSASVAGKGSKKADSKESRKNREEQLKTARSLSPKLEDIHQDITFNLPEISADYKPLRLPEYAPKKRVGGVSEEGSYIGSKHARTKLYSGRVRQTLSSVPSLFDSCMRILLDNIDSLYEIGVPYDIIKPVLEKCTPAQLIHLEDYNPYLVEDTDGLWKLHAERDFRKYKPDEMETWRELYLRKMDEREQKLKNITANISASMAKKDPGRLTKMAFVTGPAKPPRNVQRQQARHGTGRITRDPPSNPHKAYVPSKHAGDRGPIRSSSSSTIKSGDSARSSQAGGGSGGGGGSSGGGGGGGGPRDYGSISVSSCNGGSSRGGRGKSVAPMMQKALRMKKMFRR